MTSLDPSFEICKEAAEAGLVLRYDTISYRGQEINFLSDPSGTRCFAQWDGQLVDLGLNNIYYKEDMCSYVDHQLDLITTFRDYPNFVGAKLDWFHNGEYRDIRLSYKGRILKVYLTANECSAVNLSYIINDAVRVLTKSGLTEIEPISDC
jgi:hypothetical protein